MWETIYEISYFWSFIKSAGFCLLFVFIGITPLYILYKQWSEKKIHHKVFIILIGSIFILLGSFSFLTIFLQLFIGISALDNGNYLMTEGIAKRVPYSKDDIYFSVNNKIFFGKNSSLTLSPSEKTAYQAISSKKARVYFHKNSGYTEINDMPVYNALKIEIIP